MQKQAPSVGRILIAAGFAISCFLLIMFLWIAFGGPIPLKAKNYRITAYFPEATQLAAESDIRIGGVSVGKVKEVKLAPPGQANRGLRHDRGRARDPSRVRPDLRRTRVRSCARRRSSARPTSSSRPARSRRRRTTSRSARPPASPTPRQRRSSRSRRTASSMSTATRNATQIDEIFNALDPETRTAFQEWQQSAAVAVKGRSLDLNDSFGNIGPFITDASSTLEILQRPEGARSRASCATPARSSRPCPSAIRRLPARSRAPRRRSAPSPTPTMRWPRASRSCPPSSASRALTLNRLDEFQADTRPLVQKLLPVANDISPTLDSVRELSPNLESLFRNLDPLIDASEDGFPALERFLGPEGLQPLMDALDPFLSNLNPALRYLVGVSQDGCRLPDRSQHRAGWNDQRRRRPMPRRLATTSSSSRT